jgi:hypothetical protein
MSKKFETVCVNGPLRQVYTIGFRMHYRTEFNKLRRFLIQVTEFNGEKGHCLRFDMTRSVVHNWGLAGSRTH